jgi:hypothetical protein
MTAFLGTMPGAITTCFIALIILAIAVMALKRGVTVKSKAGEVFQIGNACFERTNTQWEEMREIIRSLKLMPDELQRISLNVMRLNIHDEQLPIEERIAIGELYLKCGGNGATAIYIEKLKDEYRGKYHEIMTIRKDA